MVKYKTRVYSNRLKLGRCSKSELENLQILTNFVRIFTKLVLPVPSFVSTLGSPDPATDWETVVSNGGRHMTRGPL